MKKFLLKFILFLSIGFTVLTVYANIIFSFPNPVARKLYHWFYVYEVLLKSNYPVKSDTVYLGDSVGRSLFHPDSLENAFTTNASVTIVGHYLLAKRLIEKNDNINTIIVIGIPIRFGTGLTNDRTYGYFVKPFLTFSNLKYFEKDIFERLIKVPSSFLCVFKAVKALPLDEIDFSKHRNRKGLFSEISIIYLKKLKKMCDENNIKLILLPPPVKKEYKEKYSNWKKYKTQIRELGLEEVFGDYYDNISYLDDSCYYDNWHFKHKYLKTGNNLTVLRKLTLSQK